MKPDKVASEYDRPWRVVGETGKFCRGHDTEEEAKADAEERNERARSLGIAPAYKAVPKA